MIVKPEKKEGARRRHMIAQPVKTGETPHLGDMINLAKNEPKDFARKLETVVSERKLTLQGINLRDVSRGLRDLSIPIVHVDPTGAQRAMQASAFPLLAGLLLVAELEDAYKAVETVGDELVTDFEDPKKVTIIARLDTLDNNVDEVAEGKEYPEISATEESYEIITKRNGRKITITQEMVDENDIPNIVERVNKLADIATTFVEKGTIRAVVDFFGSAPAPAEPYTLRPRTGGPVPLYVAKANIGNFPQKGRRAPSGTLLTGNALDSTENLENARVVLGDMRDDRGDHVETTWSRVKILCPNALIGKLMKLLNSENEPGVINEINNWGPKGKFRPTPISTSRLDDISPVNWFIGDFPRVFRRKWKNAFEYVTLGADTQAFLDRRIAFQGRIGWDFGVNAVDYNGVVANTPGATLY